LDGTAHNNPDEVLEEGEVSALVGGQAEGINLALDLEVFVFARIVGRRLPMLLGNAARTRSVQTAGPP
jgi:hypothetical protein